jgi:cell division septation protein DedD
MLEGYAVVWFGAEADAEEGVKVCNTGKMAGRLIDRQTRSDKASTRDGAKYYLIISSFTDEALAKAEVSKYKARGFRNPSVIQSGANFRVALGSYPSHEKAIQARNSLNDSYKNAWVLKH